MNTFESETKKILEQKEGTEKQLVNSTKALNELRALKAECDLALKEINLVNDTNKIYKAQGNALLLKTKQEAIENIDKRLQFIDNEIKKTSVKMDEDYKKLEGYENQLKGIAAEWSKSQSTSNKI